MRPDMAILSTGILPTEERPLTAVAHPTTMTPPITVALRRSKVVQLIRADREAMACILKRVAQLASTSEEEVVIYSPDCNKAIASNVRQILLKL